MKLVKPKKFLGQHFPERPESGAGYCRHCRHVPRHCLYLEVGPGMGVLTQFLVKKDRPVKVVEVDYESVAYLREAYPSLEDSHYRGRLSENEPAPCCSTASQFVLTGNYPYNISSQIFLQDAGKQGS